MKTIIIAAALLWPAFGQWDAAREQFESQVAEIQRGTETEKKQRALITQYTLKLDALQTKLASAGALDGVVAVREEINRFEGNRSVAPADQVASPAQLKQLQQIFLDTIAGFEKEQQAELAALFTKYIEYLKQEQKRLVISEKIEEAVLVKNEVDRVQAEFAGGFGLSPIVAAVPAGAPVPGGGAGAVAAPSPKGLVLYWSFDDDPPGMVNDRSGRKHDGKTYGNPRYVDGVRGKGLRISSSRQYVQCDAETFNLQGWPGLTISIWVNMTRPTTYGTLMSKSSLSLTRTNPRHTALAWSLGGSYGSKSMGSLVRLGAGDAMMNSYGPEREKHPYPATGVWQHLLVTTDAKVTRFYLNGELDTEHISEKPQPALEEKDWNPFTLGKFRSYRGTWTDSYTNGIMDELMIWSRPMSQAEARAIYARDSAARDR